MNNEIFSYNDIDVSDTNTCPECESNNVSLLCPKGDHSIWIYPAFYICWDCHNIGQVSIGKVKKIKEVSL